MVTILLPHSIELINVRCFGLAFDTHCGAPYQGLKGYGRRRLPGQQ